MKYFIIVALVVAAVAGAPVEEENKTKDKRGIFAAAPLLHSAPFLHSASLLHSAPIALPAYHSAPIISAPIAHAAPLALPAPIISHSAPIALPAIHSAPIFAHAPLSLPYGLGHYGGLLH